MTRMMRLLCVVVAGVCLPGAAYAQQTPPSAPDEHEAQPPPSPPDEQEAAIRQLLDLTGMSGTGGRVLDELFDNFEKNAPFVPAAVWQELRKEFASDDFVQLQIAIYKRHFSLEEIQGLIAFHQTPLGRKLLQLQPELMKEGMAVGQEFGRRAFERLRRQLEQRGYKTVTEAVLPDDDRSAACAGSLCETRAG